MSRRKDAGDGWALIRSRPDAGAPEPKGSPTFRVRLEKRRGRSVTVVGAERIPTAELSTLLQELRGLLATGGTVKDGALQLQGDHRPRVREILSRRGFRVKG